MRGMNRILVNRFLVSLVFVSCGLLWVSVEGAVCNPSRSCIDVGELGADCTEHNSYWCICAPGYANHSETGACIDVCDELKCTSSDANEGTCTALKGCDCKAGHANLTDGTCVPGSVCTGNKECYDFVLYDNSFLCTADESTWCKCGKGYKNSATGECVDVCENLDCNVPNTYNTCTINKGCECHDGYTNLADGTCVPYCEALDCSVSDANVGTCGEEVGCTCKDGHANLADGTCVPGSVCTGNKEECHGVCMEDNPAWCKCGKGSTNSATGECVLTCAAVQCVESASNTTGCANETGCECKKGYTNTAAGTCVADCTSCKRDPATDGTCSTDASGDVACGCKAGHVLSSTTGLCDAVSTSSTVASTSLATVSSTSLATVSSTSLATV
eukprot:Lankesteria_metandrocarpae@DN5148_c0_g1_i3.p1